MITCTEAAAEIRKLLKSKGFTSRDVSVVADKYSMGSTIHVRIKNAAVPAALVREIASGFESVHRCETTGDILGGGNRFVEVEFDRQLIATLSEPIADAISEAPGVVVEVEGWRVHRVDAQSHHYYAHRPGSREIRCWGREFCARQIAELNLARAHKPRHRVTAVAKPAAE